MRPRPFRKRWLAFLLTAACVELPEAQPGISDPTPAGGMDAPCDDYILGAAPGGDDVCFAWVAIRCDAAMNQAECDDVGDVPSPSGDLFCTWAPQTATLDALDCTELDREGRCVAAVVDADGDTCRGDRVWTRAVSSDEAQEVDLVELPCALRPVPDFDPCDQEAAAVCC